MPAIPIVILAFNRPEYLTAVLSSLVQQAGVDLSKRDVFLFVDPLRPDSLRGECGDIQKVHTPWHACAGAV